jgi:hypothetical protein
MSAAPALATADMGGDPPGFSFDARTIPVEASMRQPSRKPSIAVTGASSSSAAGKIMGTLPFYIATY